MPPELLTQKVVAKYTQRRRQRRAVQAEYATHRRQHRTAPDVEDFASTSGRAMTPHASCK